MRDRLQRGLRLALGAALLGGASAAAQPPAAPDRARTTGLPPAVSLALPLRFDSEVVRLEIIPDSVQIEGLYRFACTQARGAPLSLVYPYPSDSLMGGARTLQLEGRGPGEVWTALEFKEVSNGRGVRWVLPPCRSESLEVRTVYRQARYAPHAVYIVSSTQAWGRPLRHARFEISLPPGASEPRFSFPFELQAPRAPNARSLHVFEATEFLPDHEITVDWKEPPRRATAPGGAGKGNRREGGAR